MKGRSFNDMKRRITAIAAALSLMPLGQTLLVGTGAVLTSSLVMLSVPNVNAKTRRLICDLKTHVKFPNEEGWKNMSNRNWFLEIDNRNNLIKKLWGKNFEWTDYFNIISTDPSHLVAIKENHQSPSGNAKVSSMALNIDTGKVTYSDHFMSSGGAAFSLHYGICKPGF